MVVKLGYQMSHLISRWTRRWAWLKWVGQVMTWHTRLCIWSPLWWKRKKISELYKLENWERWYYDRRDYDSNEVQKRSEWGQKPNSPISIYARGKVEIMNQKLLHISLGFEHVVRVKVEFGLMMYELQVFFITYRQSTVCPVIRFYAPINEEEFFKPMRTFWVGLTS